MAKSSFYSGSQQASANSNAVEDSKNAAALSEAAAAASAAASATSASSASGSATTATTKASESASSATSSATSASASQASRVASEAAKVASEAAQSASENARDAAAASSTSASSSQAAASASEANSATSAAAALVSENASASSAATAATEASNSATSASASEASNVAAGVAKVAAETAETAAQTAQAAAEAAEASTEALFDQFGDQYLGPKASDPTVDNDGNPLAEGAVYFNTTDDVLKFYSGSAWVAPESVATTAAAAAQAAQAAAETAETNAETAETNAAASASSASSSASAAATSASEAAASAASINLSSIDIDGGTIDGTVIGGSVPAAGSFTTVVADGLTVDGVSDVPAIKTTVARNAADTSDIALIGNAIIAGENSLQMVSEGTINLRVGSTDYLGGYDTSNNALIVSSNGDISFYEDTGSTAKLTWDASDEALEFGDNVKATFGSSADLQVFHDGSHSYIQDVGSGNLRLKSQNFQVIGNADNEAQIETYQNGGVYLYHNGSEKLGTTAEGINVTGKITADDELAIVSASGYGSIEVGGPSGAFIDLKAPNSDDYDGRIITTGNGVVLSAGSGQGVSVQYETATKLATTATGIAVTGSVDFGDWTITESGGSLYFATGGTNKMKLDASGNLDVVGSVNSNATIS